MFISPATSGVFIAAENAPISRFSPMTLDTHMTLTLLQELLIAVGGYALVFYILYKAAEFSQ